jgi:surfactin synthase thioesterase subunit
MTTGLTTPVSGSPAQSAVGRWLAPPMPGKSQAKFKMWCFPFAGGAASIYHPWRKLAPDWLAIQPILLPGRERRIAEPCVRSLDQLIEIAAPVLAEVMSRDVVFFGYSMGAIIAFEMTRAMRRLGAPLPRHMIVAALRAPQLPDPLPATHLMADEELKRQTKQRYGECNGALDNPDLCALLLPILRADLCLCETYRYRPEAPLECPISVLGATDDWVVPPQSLSGWTEQTTMPRSTKLFDGGHFFLQDKPAEVLNWVQQELLNSGER